jgi:LAO/AO transport system kinase
VEIDAKKYYEGITSGNIALLAKAMTIIESNAEKKKKLANEILDHCARSGKNSVRIGISGMPGAGKSTLIERLGLELIERGKKVAVLAVDPSSTVSYGSILGDKTRMDKLANSEKAFIRPSPSSGSLGGVSRKTRDLITLCEAAGYDYILVETVGIRQSETEVKSITDLFMLLILPGGGDELQGIKKGAVELADLIVVNKADGEKRKLAEITKSDYQMAGRILASNSDHKSFVITLSALTGYNFDSLIENLEYFINRSKESGEFEAKRKQQKLDWLDKSLREALFEQFLEANKDKLEAIKGNIASGNISYYKGLASLVDEIS